MNECDVMQGAVVDESMPRPAGLETHVAGCAACQAFVSAHRSALRLSGLSSVPARARPLEKVKRRFGIVAGLSLAVVGAVGWFQLEFGERAPAPAVALVHELPVQVIREEGDLTSLARLQQGVDDSMHRDVRHDELDDRIFGALAAWTAPRRTAPMRSLGLTNSTVLFTMEDSP